MIVAAGAADRQAQENRADRAGDLGQLGLPLDLGDDVSADHLARTASAEAGGDQGVAIAGREVVAGELEHQEAIVGQIGVQGVDDPVAIAPGVGAFGVELEAVGVGVVSQVEPVLAPALAVMRARQQAIDQPFVGVRPVVGEEGGDLVGRRGQAGQVERDAADQGRRDRPRVRATTSSFSSSARMNRSIGFRTQPDSLTAGGSTRLHGLIGPVTALVLRE